jgi:hypothetical protein
MEKSGHAFHPDDTREIERILIENQARQGDVSPVLLDFDDTYRG